MRHASLIQRRASKDGQIEKTGCCPFYRVVRHHRSRKFRMQQYRSEAAGCTTPSSQYADGESNACTASGRICGNGKVAPLGQHPAAGRWLADAYPREVGRSRACRTSVNDDRSAEATGDTRSATQHRGTEEGDV